MTESGRKVFMDERTSSLLSITHSEVRNYGSIVSSKLLNTDENSDDSDSQAYGYFRPQGNIWLRLMATIAAASCFVRIDVASFIDLLVCGVLTQYLPRRRPPRIPSLVMVVAFTIPMISMGVTVYSLPQLSVTSFRFVVPEIACFWLCCVVYLCSGGSDVRPASPVSGGGSGVQGWPVASLVLTASAVCSHPSLVVLPLLWVYYHQLARMYGGVDHEGGITAAIHKKISLFSLLLLIATMATEVLQPTAPNPNDFYGITAVCYKRSTTTHFLLGDAWCGVTTLIAAVHYTCLAAMAAGFGGSPGSFAYNNALYQLVSPIFLLYLLLGCVLTFCLVSPSVVGIILLISTFLSLNMRSVGGPDSSPFGTSMSLIGTLAASVVISFLYFVGEVPNGSYEGALLLLIPLVTSLSGRLFIQSASSELSAATWDASDDESETDIYTYVSSTKDSLFSFIGSLSSRELVPKGTSKIISLLTFIFSSAGLVDLPHLILLVISWYIFLQRKTSKSCWKFLVIFTEFLISSTYVAGWVVPRYSSEWGTFLRPAFGDASPESLALLTLSLCFAIGHWRSLEAPDWWKRPSSPKLFSETTLTGLSLGMLLISSLQSENTEVLTVVGLLLYTVGGWVTGGAEQKKHRRIFTLWSSAVTVSLTLAIFIGRFRGCDFCSEIGSYVGIAPTTASESLFAWHLPFHAISWLCTSLIITFQLNRYKASFIESPIVAPYLFSTILAPGCILFAALTQPAFYTVVGLSYFLLAIATVLHRYSLVFNSLSRFVSPSAASSGVSVLDIGTLVSLFFIVQILFFTSFSSWTRVPLSEMYSQWVSGVSPGSRLNTYDVYDLLPHCIVLTGALLERWSWIHTRSRLFSSKIGSELLFSISYELLLAALLAAMTQSDARFGLLHLFVAILLARLGKVSVASRPVVPLIMFVMSVLTGVYCYVVVASSKMDLLLNFLVTSAAAATTIISSKLSGQCPTSLSECFDEGVSSELEAKQFIISEARRLKTSMALVLPIELKSSPLTLKVAALVPYVLLLVVFFHGSSQNQADNGSSLVPLTLTQVAKIAYSVTLLPQLESTIWKGDAGWKWGVIMYAVFAFMWFVAVLFPELSESYPVVGFRNKSLFSTLVIGALLWRWGRVMDSLFWIEVLRAKHDAHLGSKNEGDRIATERRDNVEIAHELAVQQRELRKDALRELQRKKTDMHKAWKKLMKLGADTPHKTPTLLPTPNQSWIKRESPSLPEFDRLSGLDSSKDPPLGVGQLPSTGVLFPPSFTSTVLSYVSYISYRPLTSIIIEKDYVQQFGILTSCMYIIATTLCSIGAEVIYFVTALHFLANPCIATLLPFATVLLYALVSCPMPLSGYWRCLIVYYQVLIVVKGFVLALFLAKVDSNALLLLAFGWKTILQADGVLSFMQFVIWEVSLLMLLLIHRYSLDHMFGLWYNVGVRLERLLPIRAQMSERVFTTPGIPPGHNKQFSMWGGVRHGNTILGGACVQAAAQSMAQGIIAGLGRSTRRIWRNLFNNTVKPGADYYIFAFVFDLTAWIVLLAGFSAIMGSNVGIAESIKNNLLPGSLVLVLFILFVVMVIDRVVYLARSLYSKAILHVVLTLLYLLIYLGWCYSHIERFGALKTQGTDAARWRETAFKPTLFLQLFCGLKLSYLAVSALQLRSGFVDTIQTHFFAGRYSSPWYYIYSVYRAVPFLFEFRSILDWAITSTSLKLAYWLRLEDITHELHLCLCDRYDTQRLVEMTGGEGRAYPTSWKCRSGVGFIVALSSILFFPLVWYSSIGPALTIDYVTEADIKISLSSKEASLGDLFYSKYEIPQLDGFLQDLKKKDMTISLPPKWGEGIESTRPSLAGFGLSYGDTRTLQMLPFSRSSISGWELSDAAVSDIVETLSRAILNQTELYCDVHLRLTRPYAPKNSQTISGQQSHKFGQDELRNFKAILLAESGTFALPLLYTPFAFSRSEELLFFQGNQPIDDAQNIASNRINCMLSLHEGQRSYWGMNCTTLFKNGNPPVVAKTSGLSGLNFSDQEEACINATIYEESSKCGEINYDLDNSVPEDTTSGPYFLAISDLVTNGSMLIPSLGVIALYTTFVLAVGRVLRASLTGDASKLHLTNMDSPDPLSTLIGYIHMARIEGDLELEHGLFHELVALLKSHEVMRQYFEVQTSAPSGNA